MKIFHKENNRTVVYVQMQDLMFIVHDLDDIAIPASIMNYFFSKSFVIVNDSNRFDFVKFDKEPEVAFFKTLNFIIDYNDYKDLTDEQFQERFKSVVGEYNGLAKKWNKMPETEREKNINLLVSIQKLEHTIKFIHELYDLKHGNSSMTLPDFINN